MNSASQIAILIAISASASGISWLARDKNPKPTPVQVCDPANIKTNEICFDQVPEQALWIDARTRIEWRKNGHPDSILWNLDPGEDSNKMEADAFEKIAESKFVVVYCSSQACGTSRQIAEKIRKLELGVETKILHGGHPSLRLKQKR
jgi:rhodanese-related sulfurtransferase